MIRLCTCIGLFFLASLSFAQTATQYKRIANVIDSYPVLAPDGGTILFQSNRSGNFEIYSMKADGTGLKQLTQNDLFDGTPVWSPDGKQVVFASERDNDSEIYLMNADGSDQKRITHIPGDDSHPKFSPDGKRIIFCSAKATPDLKADWAKQWIEVFTMNTDGSDMRQITNNKTISTYPSFSPDGKKIVFRMVTNEPAFTWTLGNTGRNSEVFVIDSDGKNLVNISNNAAFDGWPVWSPGGRSILFASNRNGPAYHSQLFMADADGKNLKQVTYGEQSFTQPSFSADGRSILAYNFYETASYEFGGIAILEL